MSCSSTVEMLNPVVSLHDSARLMVEMKIVDEDWGFLETEPSYATTSGGHSDERGIESRRNC